MSTMRRERLLLWLSLAANCALLFVFIGFMSKWKLTEVQLANERRSSEGLLQRLKEAESTAKSRATNKPSLTDAEVLELARLRNEVTQLRKEFRAATNAPAASRAATTVPSPPADPPPAADVVTFTNTVSATIPLGHSLALGGWVEPGTGKRILSFITPETSPDAPGSVLVQARLMSVPDALLDRFGLQGLRAELPPGQPPANFDAARFPVLLKAMEQTDGVDILSMPRVLTLSGRQAQVAVLDTQAGHTTGPSVLITPTLDASGTAVRLDVGVELKLLPAAKP